MKALVNRGSKHGGSGMKAFAYLLVAVGACILAILLFVWSGFYDISAREPHWRLTHWFMERVRDRSIAAHSEAVKLPELDRAKFLQEGVDHYQGMCRLCHGAPGYPRMEFAKGLYPSPPELSSPNMQAWSDAELYWIISNGIKMTGMPAFGATHDEPELMGVLALLRRLPQIQPDEYRRMLEATDLSGNHGDHPHGAPGNGETGSAEVEPGEHHH
jgi:mono/diheme cytochrome c family protein